MTGSARSDRGIGPRYERRREGPFDPGLLVGSTDDEILRSFLELVRTWRGLGTRSAKHPVQLRAADVAVLVAILGSDTDEIERHLLESTGCTPRAARRGRRLLLASGGALAIGLLSASSFAGTQVPTATRMVVSTAPLVPFDGVDRALVRPSAAAPATTAKTVTPATPSADAASLIPVDPVAPAVVPAGSPGAPPAPAAPPSGAPLPAGIEATVTIAGVDLPVVLGGQPVIDQGVVAHYTAPGWEPPVAPGGVGTYWLAAHRTTHGAPFARLPDLAVGAEIRVNTGDQAFVYTVTSTEVTGLYPGDEAVYGTDPTASTILLQTCLDAERRLLVRGILSATL